MLVAQTYYCFRFLMLAKSDGFRCALPNLDQGRCSTAFSVANDQAQRPRFRAVRWSRLLGFRSPDMSSEVNV
jgi:hypothetical protein